MTQKKECKICNNKLYQFIDHTARCTSCGVLLFYPYPDEKKIENVKLSEEQNYEWYENSFVRKLEGFKDIISFVFKKSSQKEYKILDYGGSSGQFALIFKSVFPKADVFITDINDNSLFKEYSIMNKQIKFNNFNNDINKFDVIFLNDVYEHVSDPVNLIEILEKKLNDDGLIFIDTPRQFWIYPFFKLFNKYIYRKILRGTVSGAHLQIWNEKSFKVSLRNTKLKIFKKKYYTELTQDPEYYVRGMTINNKFLKRIIIFGVSILLFTFKNKIFVILKK